MTSNTPTVKIDDLDAKVLSLVHSTGFKPQTEAIAQQFQKLLQLGFLRLSPNKNSLYSRLTDKGKAALDAYIKLKSN
jgi:predicted transcriptional regulator